MVEASTTAELPFRAVELVERGGHVVDSGLSVDPSLLDTPGGTRTTPVPVPRCTWIPGAEPRSTGDVDRVRRFSAGEGVGEGDHTCLRAGEDLSQDGAEVVVGRIVRPQREDAAGVEVAGEAAQARGRVERGVVDDYRIIYTIDDGVLLVVVVTLGHRRDFYDR